MLFAIKENDRVYLAFNLRDMPFNCNDKEDYKLEDNVPVWKVKKLKNCIMGSMDNVFSERDLIRYDENIISGKISVDNILENIVPAMKKKLESFQKLDGDGDMGNSYIIAKDERAYYITLAGDCIEIDSFYTRGGGNRVAIASLEMNEGLPATERIERAFKDIEKAINIPSYPIAVMDTKTQKLKIIEGKNAV